MSKSEVENHEKDNGILSLSSEFDHERMLEAIFFASKEPVGMKELSDRMPKSAKIVSLIEKLELRYKNRGFRLIKVSNGYTFRTAPDLSFLLQKHVVEQRRLSKAALEVLAIIAYHQSSTRAEIEEIRGVSVSSGTLDTLMEIGWIGLGSRRNTPGRPLTFKTTGKFLSHFGLASAKDLPGMSELRENGLLERRPISTDDSQEELKL
ncbi:MAG: SMC-Scp complex subunit ScpB [Pseudomonadota bacterium]|nr:SMC-Scp complex subunit ScpB [Pseudomonadota bacterium]